MIGEVLNFFALIWVLKQAFGEGELAFELKVYLVITFLGLVDCILAAILIVLIIAILLAVLVLLFFIGGIVYIKNTIKRYFHKQKREKLF